MEIFAARQLLVPFAESLAPGWQPVVPGGLWHKEFMDMVTPPQARPYAAFRNGELLQVAATSFANAMAMRAAKKAFVSARTSRRNRRVAQIRREVESELEEVRKKSSAAATAQGRQ